MYRDSARRDRPVERILVRSERLWGVLAILVIGIIVITAISYGSVNIDCVRPAAGEPARCTAHQFPGGELRPFPLERGSLRAVRTMPDTKNHRYPMLQTPGGTLSGSGIDSEFTERTAGEADRFYEDTNQLEWHAGQTKWVLAAVFDSIFLFFITLVVLGGLTKRLDLDPNLRTVTLQSKSWPLDAIDDVVVEPIKDFRRLSFVINGERVPICSGNTASIEDAAKRIRAAQKEAL